MTIVGLLVFNPLWPLFKDGVGDVLRWSTVRIGIFLGHILQKKYFTLRKQSSEFTF
jgi:hypothetical protein